MAFPRTINAVETVVAMNDFVAEFLKPDKERLTPLFQIKADGTHARSRQITRGDGSDTNHGAALLDTEFTKGHELCFASFHPLNLTLP